jgi:hypothetical protein
LIAQKKRKHTSCGRLIPKYDFGSCSQDGR